MECYWASLNTNDGVANQAIPGNGGSYQTTWEIFETNNTDVFGTCLWADTSVERNIKFDDTLLIKEPGLIIASFKVRWPNGAYARRCVINSTQGSLNDISLGTGTSGRPMNNWATTDHDVQEDYQTFKWVGGASQFVNFLCYNTSGVSKTITWRSAYVLWFDTSGGAVSIFDAD